MTPPDHSNAPDHAGPPDHALKNRAQRRDDGAIEVGDAPLEELSEQIDWENLTPIEEYLLRRLEQLE